ncbi:hypothetical protein [Maribacter sp. 4G9]|uniref:hypothetical protein n=1 Tax=Maribacter sp. 4G9 TaxID=1889777 RepID=UPI000C1570DA|nr:hypothetical protein [Maribacter sp. 4G9]PIB27877.1 hypothetical protein BFP75_06320 [Maribacter sp. 4G9]
MSKEEQIRFTKMTKRSLKEFNQIEAQGWVVNISVQIEDLIDDILIEYFQPSDRRTFLNVLLNSSVMHFGGKLKVLRSIGIDGGIYSSLQRIGSIRNAFAHTNISHSMTITWDPESDAKTDVKDVINVMNSNGEIKSKDPYSYMVEFLELYKQVEPVLKKMRDDIFESLKKD